MKFLEFLLQLFCFLVGALLEHNFYKGFGFCLGGFFDQCMDETVVDLIHGSDCNLNIASERRVGSRRLGPRSSGCFLFLVDGISDLFYNC